MLTMLLLLVRSLVVVIVFCFLFFVCCLMFFFGRGSRNGKLKGELIFPMEEKGVGVRGGEIRVLNSLLLSKLKSNGITTRNRAQSHKPLCDFEL